MDVVKFSEAPFYTLAGHEQIMARRLQGGNASRADFAVIGHSSFPPRAVVPMDEGSIGKIYVVSEGSLTIEEASGHRHVLTIGDSVFIAAGEARAVFNDAGAPATMIVITPPANI